MKISLNNIGKRYRYEWIFRGITFEFLDGQSYAISGANGSGKSTLMKILSGHLTPSGGKIVFSDNGKVIDADEVYRKVAFAAPYIELIEEFTLLECLRFHARFKPFLAGLDISSILGLLDLPSSGNKELRFFSSGMKQRVKLLLALCSDTPILLLDEPTTNLDRQGIDWYLQLIDRFARQRLLIIASNVEEDFGFCRQRLNVQDYKKKAGVK